MAPDVDLLRDIGIVALGVIIFLVPLPSVFLQLAAYVLVGYGVAHMLFRINLNKTTEKKR